MRRRTSNGDGKRSMSVLGDSLSAVQRYEAALPEEEAVHEMRVATRRLRAALRLLHLRNFDRDVKMLQDALGDVRDLQLQVSWVRDRDQALYRARQAKLKKAEQALDPALRRWQSHTLPALLWAVANCSAPSQTKVVKTLRKRLKRLEQRLERARVRPSPGSLHAARISVKQVRYLLDAAKKALPKKVTRLEADLKTLQASLGELHDVDARIDLLKRRPALLRDQKETRDRLGKIAAAQLARWHKQHLVRRAVAALH